MITLRQAATACVLISTVTLQACAGRDANPVLAYQPHDGTRTCADLNSEITINNNQMTKLDSEGSGKAVGNVALGVVGALLFWPALFAMDFKDAAGKEHDALEARNARLTSMRDTNCAAQATARAMPAAPPTASELAFN